MNERTSNRTQKKNPFANYSLQCGENKERKKKQHTSLVFSLQSLILLFDSMIWFVAMCVICLIDEI